MSAWNIMLTIALSILIPTLTVFLWWEGTKIKWAIIEWFVVRRAKRVLRRMERKYGKLPDPVTTEDLKP